MTQQPEAAPCPKDIGDVPQSSDSVPAEDKKVCCICQKPYDNCNPGARFGYVVAVKGELDMIYFCGNECWFAYLGRKQAEGVYMR